MRGRPNLWVRTEKLKQRRPMHDRWRSNWNLDVLSVEELESLMPLAEKRVASAPDEPDWTPEEIALLERLWIKASGACEVPS